MRMKRAAIISILMVAAQGCGPSIEEHIHRLGAGGDEAELAKQGLLIAKGDAVPLLLNALEDPRFTAGRAELAEVLVELMTRVDDERLSDALRRHLRRSLPRCAPGEPHCQEH